MSDPVTLDPVELDDDPVQTQWRMGGEARNRRDPGTAWAPGSTED